MKAMSVTFQGGDLIIATVSLIDPNFQQTVVLLCRHDDTEGSYGLVLNRPVEPPEQILDELPFVDKRLFLGGPVQPDTMQVLHSMGAEIPGSAEVLPGIWIGGDFDVLRSGIDGKELPVDRCRFFLGYAGWAGGQLAGEFAADTWIRAPADADFVMNTAPRFMWSRAVRGCGRQDPLYANFPDHPNWN